METETDFKIITIIIFNNNYTNNKIYIFVIEAFSTKWNSNVPVYKTDVMTELPGISPAVTVTTTIRPQTDGSISYY